MRVNLTFIVWQRRGSIQLNFNRLFNRGIDGVLLVLKGVPLYNQNSVEKSAEIQLN